MMEELIVACKALVVARDEWDKNKGAFPSPEMINEMGNIEDALNALSAPAPAVNGPMDKDTAIKTLMFLLQQVFYTRFPAGYRVDELLQENLPDLWKDVYSWLEGENKPVPALAPAPAGDVVESEPPCKDCFYYDLPMLTCMYGCKYRCGNRDMFTLKRLTAPGQTKEGT